MAETVRIEIPIEVTDNTENWTENSWRKSVEYYHADS